MERNSFSNFGRGSPMKRFCEIILKSGHWPRGEMVFLALAAILFSRAKPFYHILVECNPRNISMKLF